MRIEQPSGGVTMQQLNDAIAAVQAIADAAQADATTALANAATALTAAQEADLKSDGRLLRDGSNAQLPGGTDPSPMSVDGSGFVTAPFPV